MLSLSCSQIPECEQKLSLKQQLLCKVFVIYGAGSHPVYVPMNPDVKIRRAKKTGYEIAEVSWTEIERTALGLTIIIANKSFPKELIPFAFIPSLIEYIDEKKLIKKWREQ